jgi:flagellar motor switch protein FliM
MRENVVADFHFEWTKKRGAAHAALPFISIHEIRQYLFSTLCPVLKPPLKLDE